MLGNRNAPRVSIRQATFDDYLEIKDLQTPYGMQTNSRDEWTHLWANNPVYRQFAGKWPIGWVLEDSNRKIIGYIGNVPLSYELKGRKLLAASSRGWVVDSRYRSYSMLLLDYFFSQSEVDLYLTTNVNSKIFEGFGFFGPLRVPAGDWDHSSFWITNYIGFVASSLRTKDVPWARPLSYPLCVLPFLRDQFSKIRSVRNRSNADVQFCSHFDERFDAFWEELKRKRADVLLGTRSRETLDWHFRYALLRNRAWILYVADGARLLAYAIFYRKDNPSIALKRLYLVDFQTLLEDERVLIPMLSCALKRSRLAGIHTLEIVGLGAHKARLIAQLTPYRRKLSCWSAFYKANKPWLAECLTDSGRWDLSLFDGDTTLSGGLVAADARASSNSHCLQRYA